MQRFVESQLEEAALEWFESLGYESCFAPEFAPDGTSPERISFRDVILVDRLSSALQDINPHLPIESIQEVLKMVVNVTSPSLTVANKAFHSLLVNGVDVHIRQNDNSYKVEKAYLVDTQNIQNNQFMVANQFSIEENGITKRPDLIVFMNGIPLVVIELKSAIEENVDLSHAYRQLQTYKKTISTLFHYNSFLVISDGINTKAGTITSDEDWFMMWRTIDGNGIEAQHIPSLEVLIKGMFEKERFIDIIRNFVLFQHDKTSDTKILAGYHQYHAVNKAIENSVRATQTAGDRRVGVIWHTQGSGKSLSMVFYAGKLVLHPKLENPTIVVITDRNDLDDQLFETFLKSQDILRNQPVQANDRTHLRKLLNQRESGGIIFTTIQKFSPDESSDSALVLTQRKNVIVLADEAHRSQYGFAAEVVKSKNLDEATIKYGYAKYMRDSLPNASYIGFTGTPIELTDKSTQAVFGNYIDTYDMTRAVEDGTTVKIFYESRIAKLELPESLKPKIDLEYEDITEYQETSQKEQLKSKWARLEAIVGAQERVNVIAKDIVQHLENREKSQEFEGGKAMIVAMSRRIAIELYKAIVVLKPEWHNMDLNKGKIKIVMTGSSADPLEWQDFIGTKSTRESLAKRFKDRNDELKLVIVRDMWLTGFDVPSMHTMYIDKPMSGHNLMQAIARVNRVFKEKQGGLVVDYIGIAQNLKDALAQYTEGDRKTAGVDTQQAADILLEKMHLIHDLLHGFSYQKFMRGKASDKMQAIIETMDFILGKGEKIKKDYIDLVNELSKAFSLCSTTTTAQVLNIEVGFHKAVKAALVKLMTDESKKKTLDQLDNELNQLISKSISSNEVVDILQSAGLSKPDISILSDEFLEEVKGMKQKNLAVELLQRLLKGKLKSFARRNLIQSKKFSEMLENTLTKYNNRAIEVTMLIEELIQLAKELSEAEHRGDNTGLTSDELAFYDALADNMSARDVLGTDILKEIAIELTKSIKSNMSVDWTVRESVQANMRMVIKRLLKKYGYPPDQTSKATDTVLEQARLMVQMNLEL